LTLPLPNGGKEKGGIIGLVTLNVIGRTLLLQTLKEGKRGSQGSPAISALLSFEDVEGLPLDRRAVQG